MNVPLTAAPLDGFSGSYAPEDVTFLLKRVRMRPTPIEEKERRIQTGTRRRPRTLITRCHDERLVGSMSWRRGPARNTASHPWRARDVRLSCRSPAPRSPCCVPISARR